MCDCSLHFQLLIMKSAKSRPGSFQLDNCHCTEIYKPRPEHSKICLTSVMVYWFDDCRYSQGSGVLLPEPEHPRVKIVLPRPQGIRLLASIRPSMAQIAIAKRFTRLILPYYAIPSLKLTNCTWKWMLGKLVSFWDGLLAGAMLVSGSVYII